MVQHAHMNTMDIDPPHINHRHIAHHSPSQESTHTASSSRSRKWTVPEPVVRRQPQPSQAAAFRGVFRTPIERVREVIGEDFAEFVTMECASVFVAEIGFSNRCLQAATEEETDEYKRRHEIAEQIANAERAENFKRAHNYLHLLADVWIVDQGFYHTTLRKRKGFCPVCQIHYFRKILTRSEIKPEDRDVDSAPTQKRPFKGAGLMFHINTKRGHCLGHDLFAKFLTQVRGFNFN